jgi:hypothetical protein
MLPKARRITGELTSVEREIRGLKNSDLNKLRFIEEWLRRNWGLKIHLWLRVWLMRSNHSQCIPPKAIAKPFKKKFKNGCVSRRR